MNLFKLICSVVVGPEIFLISAKANYLVYSVPSRKRQKYKETHCQLRNCTHKNESECFNEGITK